MGVKPDVTTDGITKAYRKLAMKHHPDKGGDPEQFRKISKAYKVLGDSVRRNRYDETGVEEELDENEALSVLMQFVTQGVFQIIKSESDPARFNLKAFVSGKIVEELQEIKERVILNDRRIGKLRAIASLVVTKEPENLIAKGILNPIRNLEDQIHLDGRRVEMLGMAAEILDKYDYLYDKKSSSSKGPYGSEFMWISR